MKKLHLDESLKTGTVQWTERDLNAIEWIADQHSIHLDHLQQLLGSYDYPNIIPPRLPSQEAVINVVERWLQLGWIDPPQETGGGAPFIWLSRYGHGFTLSTPYVYSIPLPQRLAHLSGVNAVRLHVEATYRITFWNSERSLLRDPYFSHPLVPDAEIYFARLTIALQVIEKAPLNLCRLVCQLASQYQRVWYYVHPTATRAMEEALLHLPASLRALTIVHDLESFTSIGLHGTGQHDIWEHKHLRYLQEGTSTTSSLYDQRS